MCTLPDKESALSNEDREGKKIGWYLCYSVSKINLESYVRLNSYVKLGGKTHALHVLIIRIAVSMRETTT